MTAGPAVLRIKESPGVPELQRLALVVCFGAIGWQTGSSRDRCHGP
jgi:hypothetical protein